MGTGDIPDSNIFIFEIPSGIPLDSTTFTIQVNGQTDRAWLDESGTALRADYIVAGDRATVIRDGAGIYSIDNVAAARAFVSVAYTDRHLTFRRADSREYTFPLLFPEFQGLSGRTGFANSFIVPTRFQEGDSAVVGNLLYLLTQLDTTDYTPATIDGGAHFITFPILNGTTGALEPRALAQDTPTDGQVLAWNTTATASANGLTRPAVAEAVAT